VAWLYLNLFSRLDPPLLRWSKGRLSFTPGVPVLLLETTGAKSGQTRETPLVYALDGDNVVLIASNGGGPKNPAWVHNLRANPLARATLRGGTGHYLAREAEGEERERLWEAALAVNPGYAFYQERAGERRIPVIVLEPAAG
jgi:deazaflavin-dependent oxidoreductase (nitroreductase family)